MFPISILLGARLAKSSRQLNTLFLDLSRRLQKRLTAARSLEAGSRAFPVVVFRGDAVTAWIDRFQHGAVRKKRPEDGAVSLADGGRRFVRGLGRIPDIVEAHLVIRRTLVATGNLLRTALGFLDSTRGGMTVRARLLQIATASKDQPQGPGLLDVLLDNSKRLPRIVAAGAVGMVALADFLRALADERGRGLLVFGEGAHTLGKSLGEVFAELFPADGAPDTGSPAPPRALHDPLRDVVGGLVFALFAVPWAGLYLGPLFRKLLLGVQVRLVELLLEIEGLGWDFRQMVLEVFFVSFESLQRKAVDWLEGLTNLVLSLLTFGLGFAEIYLFELFVGLRTVTRKIGEVLATIADVIFWVGTLLGTLFKLSLGSILPGLGAGLTFYDLIQAFQGKGPLARLLGSTPAKVSKATRIEVRGPGGKVLLVVTILNQKDPDPPTITRFPQLLPDLLGKGPNSLVGILRRVRGMTEGLVADILLVGQALLVDSERGFDQLRQDAASLDLDRSFGHLVKDSRRIVDSLLEPERRRIERQGASGFERMSAILSGVLLRGGFDVVGASIRGYTLELDRLWSAQKASEAHGETVVISETGTGTSPHKISRRARLGTVRVPRMTVRAAGRDLDPDLRQKVAAEVRRLVARAHARGRQRLDEARAAG